MTAEHRDQLLPAIQAGDPGAFAEWLKQAEPRVRDSLGSFAKVVDTEAVLQEALLRMWQVAARVQVDARGDALLRLAVRVARNLAIDVVRSAGHQGAVASVGDEQTDDLIDDQPPPDPLLRRLIQACSEQLPKKPRLAFVTRLTNGGADSDETLAEQVGMKLNTFLQNFGRARKFLAECLAKQGVDLAEFQN